MNLLLSIIGLTVIAAIVGLGAYWLIDNVRIKKDNEHE